MRGDILDLLRAHPEGLTSREVALLLRGPDLDEVAKVRKIISAMSSAGEIADSGRKGAKYGGGYGKRPTVWIPAGEGVPRDPIRIRKRGPPKGSSEAAAIIEAASSAGKLPAGLLSNVSYPLVLAAVAHLGRATLPDARRLIVPDVDTNVCQSLSRFGLLSKVGRTPTHSGGLILWCCTVRGEKVGLRLWDALEKEGLVFSDPRAPARASERKVLGILRDGGPSTVQGIVEAAGICRSQVRVCLDELAARGLVRHTVWIRETGGGWVWEAT